MALGKMANNLNKYCFFYLATDLQVFVCNKPVTFSAENITIFYLK